MNQKKIKDTMIIEGDWKKEEISWQEQLKRCHMRHKDRPSSY